MARRRGLAWLAGLDKLEDIPWNYQLGWGSFPEGLKAGRKVISEKNQVAGKGVDKAAI